MAGEGEGEGAGVARRKKVLVVGGTGYLGQHLLRGFSQYDLAFTFNTNPSQSLLLEVFPNSLSFLVDLRTGAGLDSVLDTFGQPDVVVNCAALSVPRACEADPAAAAAVNVPTALVNWLSTFTEDEKKKKKKKNALLIHLSTDQVYEGVKSFYKEDDDEAAPVNVYGKSKLEAERFISSNWSNYALLRSSIIYGPQTVSPVPKSLPIQWIDNVLSKGSKADFFHDEYRCPIYVKDVVDVVIALAERWFSDGEKMQLLLNLGGPDRVSRVQMAEAVACVRGYNLALINSVSASSVDRGVKSPADISMDITKLVETLGISPTPFLEGVRLTLESVAAAGS